MGGVFAEVPTASGSLEGDHGLVTYTDESTLDVLSQPTRAPTLAELKRIAVARASPAARSRSRAGEASATNRQTTPRRRQNSAFCGERLHPATDRHQRAQKRLEWLRLDDEPRGPRFPSSCSQHEELRTQRQHPVNAHARRKAHR